MKYLLKLVLLTRIMAMFFKKILRPLNIILFCFSAGKAQKLIMGPCISSSDIHRIFRGLNFGAYIASGRNKKILSCLLLLTFLFFMPFIVFADDYIIGKDDVLDINVYENEDLSTTVRVSTDSNIRVPLIGEISVKGLTVSQISEKIENLFADGYLINPQVDVFISKYGSKKAVILGEVKKPGQYELRGKITLLEFISMAEGLTPNAGGNIIIKRVNKPDNNSKKDDIAMTIITKIGKGLKAYDYKPVDQSAADVVDTADKTGAKNKTGAKIVIDLEMLVKKGKTSLNIMIMNDDSVYISKAKTYYVSGEVNKPNSYKYEPDITVIKAITMAGGYSKIASKGKVKIIRTIDGGKKTLKKVDINEPVLPDDIIVVPESFF